MGRPRRKEMLPIPPKTYEAARLVDSEHTRPDERETHVQKECQSEEHKSVMRLFGALTNALNAGYRFEERA